jgi:hypothetical protein
MKLFRKDPAAELGSTQAALLQIEARLRQMEIDRTARLEAADDNYLDEVAKIDREKAILNNQAAVHRDRLVVLERRVCEHDRQQLTLRQAEAVAIIRRSQGASVTAAKKLDAGLKQVAEAVSELDAADEATFSTNWTDELPPVSRLLYLRSQTIEPLSTMRRVRPAMAGLVRELVYKLPFNFTQQVEQRNAELIAELESAGLPEPQGAVA